MKVDRSKREPSTSLILEAIAVRLPSVNAQNTFAPEMATVPNGQNNNGGADDRGDSAGRDVLPPSAQIAAIALTALLILGGVLICLLYGYRPKRHDVDPTFVWLQIAILAIAGVSHFELIERLWSYIVRKEYRPSRLSNWWQERRETEASLFTTEGVLSFKGITYLLAALTITAMWFLVADTGGGIISPFAPLLAAAAVVGTFVAVKKQGVIALTVIVASLTLFGDSPWSPHHKAQKSDPTPAWWVFGFVALVLIGIAGLVSYARLSNGMEDPTRSEVLPPTIRRELASIRQAVGRLEARLTDQRERDN
jgi:hypothetical protein